MVILLTKYKLRKKLLFSGYEPDSLNLAYLTILEMIRSYILSYTIILLSQAFYFFKASISIFYDLMKMTGNMYVTKPSASFQTEHETAYSGINVQITSSCK